MEKRIKIYKTATDVSIMDILDSLNYHKENRKKELVYKGNLEFTINEFGTTKQQTNAYVSKANAKLLFNSISNHTFHNIFPNGFDEYGGGEDKTGKVRSRILSVTYEQGKNRFKFQIDEGSGERKENGSVQMVKRENTARTYVNYIEAVKMAIEVVDFIKHAEGASMINGIPYYTIVPNYRQSHQGLVSNVSTHYNSQPDLNHAIQNSNVESPYIIKIGTLTGTPINELDTNSLEALVAKLNPDTPDLVELLQETKKELSRRY